jgi:hypothetical protein
VEELGEAVRRQGPKSGNGRAVRKGDDVAQECVFASKAGPMADVKVEDTATDNADIGQDKLLNESQWLKTGMGRQACVNAGQ